MKKKEKKYSKICFREWRIFEFFFFFKKKKRKWNLMGDDDNGIRSIWAMGVLIKWLDVTSRIVIGITWPQQGHAWCLLMASPTFQLHDNATKAFVIYLPSRVDVRWRMLRKLVQRSLSWSLKSWRCFKAHQPRKKRF